LESIHRFLWINGDHVEQSDHSDIPDVASCSAQRSTAWKEFWLLSYLSPYLLLFAIIAFFGNVEPRGYAGFLALLLPLALGIIGTICSLAASRLPLWLTTFYFIVTLVGYVLGLVIFCFVIALIFGVVAT
jgi:hypothetical protein